jgi:hypothetical protein
MRDERETMIGMFHDTTRLEHGHSTQKRQDDDKMIPKHTETAVASTKIWKRTTALAMRSVQSVQDSTSTASRCPMGGSNDTSS